MPGGSVQEPFDRKRDVTAVDLGTIRATLDYIRQELERVGALERAARLLGAALAEVETAERRGLASIPRSILEPRCGRRRGH